MFWLDCQLINQTNFLIKQTEVIILNQFLMNPFLRNAIKVTWVPLGYDIIVSDCRIIYSIDYNLMFCHDNKKHILYPGDMVYIPKGTVYRFDDFENASVPHVLILNFDITRNIETDTNILFPIKYEEGISIPHLHQDISFNSLTEADFFYKDVRILRNKAFLLPLMNDIVKFFSRHDDLSLEIASCRTKELLIKLSYENPDVYSKVVRIVKESIDSRYNENLTNKSLAKELGYHENALNRLFLSETNYTIRQYLLSIRISKAKSLLSETSIPLVEIAEATGFNNYSYFSYYFKQKEGITPKEFRENRRYLT